MTTVIGLDPGGSTGVAFFSAGHPGETEDKWDFHTLGPDEHHEELFDILDKTYLAYEEIDAVVYEEFLYQRRELDRGVSLVLDSKEYIGVIKLWHQQVADPDCELVPQSPSIGKDNPSTFWNDQKLRRLGLWRSIEHERDAVRHILYYVTFTLNDRRFIQKLQ